MKKLRKSLSRLIIITLIFTVFFVQSSHLIASDHPDDDVVEGNLITSSNNNKVRITDFDLINEAGLTIITDDRLNPNLVYTAKVTVYDTDSIKDLNSATFYFYHEEVAATTKGGLTLDESIVTDGSGLQFVVNWNVTTQAMTVVENQDSHTWNLESSIVPSEEDRSKNEFTFEITFSMSKVAKETATSAWYFGAIIEDGAENVEGELELSIFEGLILGKGSNEIDAPTTWGMNFYGELNISQSNISWMDVKTGTNFDHIDSLSIILGMTYIANGDYQTFIKSSSHWNALVTQEDIDRLIPDYTVTYILAFKTAYDLEYPTTPLTSTGLPSDLVGLSYIQMNQVIQTRLDADIIWKDIKFELPENSVGSNLEGASLVTEGFISTQSILTGQHFMIGYDPQNLEGLTFEEAYALVGSDFRMFMPNELLIQTSTSESGETTSLNLYISLSDIFQNAHYQGSITVQITND